MDGNIHLDTSVGVLGLLSPYITLHLAEHWCVPGRTTVRVGVGSGCVKGRYITTASKQGSPLDLKHTLSLSLSLLNHVKCKIPQVNSIIFVYYIVNVAFRRWNQSYTIIPSKSSNYFLPRDRLVVSSWCKLTNIFQSL